MPAPIPSTPMPAQARMLAADGPAPSSPPMTWPNSTGSTNPTATSAMLAATSPAAAQRCGESWPRTLA